MFSGAFSFIIKQLTKKIQRLHYLDGTDFSHLNKGQTSQLHELSSQQSTLIKAVCPRDPRSLLTAEEWERPGITGPVLSLYTSEVFSLAMQTKTEFTAASSFKNLPTAGIKASRPNFPCTLLPWHQYAPSAAESIVSLTKQTSSTAQVTQVSLFTGLLNLFCLSVPLYCISNFLSKVQPFPLASYLIFQSIFTMLPGETSQWTHPSSLSGAAFLPAGDGQVLSDALQTHKKQEIFCPAKDESSYLPWHLTPTPE